MQNPIDWLVTKLKTTNKEIEDDMPTELPSSISGSPCCDALVHIAYRGISDDHLYMAYDRKWPEVKFFRPNGLRAYCQKCRQRVL